MEKPSYTHAVVQTKDEKVLKIPLQEVSFALLQIKEMVESEENLTLLLWIIGYFKSPKKSYFSDPSKSVFRETLMDNRILFLRNNQFVLDEVFAQILWKIEQQNNLFFRGFKLLQKSKSAQKTSLEGEEISSTELEELAATINLEIDFWNSETGRYSNPDVLPESYVKVKLPRKVYNYLKTLEW